MAVNNGGGGIFSFLPVADFTAGFESHFATAHAWKLSPLAAAFGIHTVTAPTGAALSTALADFAASPRPTFVEVFTERLDNAALHRRLHRIAIEAAEAALDLR